MAFSSSLSLAVQVTERGQIYTSESPNLWDLWIPRDSGTVSALRSVTFAGNRVVIVGENGAVLYADDLNQFLPGTLLDGPTTDWLEGVAASTPLNLLVAVGDNGAIYTSGNGAQWKRQATGYPEWLRGVASGGGRFVAVGESGVILTSGNGTNWGRAYVSSADWNWVAYGNGVFTAAGSGGSVMRSADGGGTWTPEPTGATNELYTVNGANGSSARVVAGVDGVRLKDTLASPAWEDQLLATNAPPRWTYLGSLGLSNFFLLSGRTGMLVEGYKTNGTPYDWFTSFNSIRPWLFDVHYISNLFVTVGDRAAVMTSPSGVDWTVEVVPPSVTNSIFLGVGGDSNLLVAVGDHGSLMISPNNFTSVPVTITNGTNIIFTNQLVSTIGILWHAIEPRPVTEDLQGVAAGHGLYVVTGDLGEVLFSPNGTNWTLRYTPTGKYLSSVTAWPGGFVATGDDGAIVTSPNGTNWFAQGAGLTTNWLYRVRYLGGKLIAVGQNGAIFTSTNATNWVSQTSGTTRWLHDVVKIDDTWFAIGKQGTLLSSTNTTGWTSRDTITLKSMYAAATDSRRLITVGLEGCILRSRVMPGTNSVDFLSYARFTSTNAPTLVQNLFLLGGEPDQRINLLGNTNVATTNWASRATIEFINGASTLFYLESIPTNGAPGWEFYRSKVLP